MKIAMMALGQNTTLTMMEVIDSSNSSLTVSWPPTKGAKRYVLQYHKATSSDQVVFETLSDKLTATQARKKNLEATPVGYMFRVGAIKGDEDEDPTIWVTHEEPFHLLSDDDEANRMAAPKPTAGGHEAVLVSWEAVDGATGYELQMRENQGGAAWTTLSSSLANTQVRKKHLSSNNGYMFRVRPAGSDAAFSLASDVVKGGGLSPGIKRVFGMLEEGKLLTSPAKAPVTVGDALAGKEFVLLYASAHWCGPCRQFTPQLATWYQQNKKSVEVVFLSADHDEKGFKSYFASMPWAAVPFDDDGREQLMGWIKVTGIPRLVVLDGKTGRILVDNVVGQSLDIIKWRQLASK